MKPIKITAVLILFLLLLEGILFPRITSRVEGTIVDEETGKPIAGASVGLFQCITHGNFVQYSIESNRNARAAYLETDNKGFFRFDDKHKGKYFLVIFKDGYAAVGPFFYKKPGFFEDNYGRALSSQIEGFYLEEGQIKHFKIKMEKEAILKVTVLRKTLSGIEPIDVFKVLILHPRFADKFEERINLDEPIITDKRILERQQKYFKKKYTPLEDGFQTIYFKKGAVSLTIEPNGYPPKTFENILLEKGQTKLFEYVVDFTKPPVIYGIIKNKDTGEPFPIIYINIEKQDDPNKYFYLRYNTLDGKYWLAGMPQGTYLLNIYSIGGEKKFDYEMVIKVITTSALEINKEF